MEHKLLTKYIKLITDVFDKLEHLYYPSWSSNLNDVIRATVKYSMKSWFTARLTELKAIESGENKAKVQLDEVKGTEALPTLYAWYNSLYDIISDNFDNLVLGVEKGEDSYAAWYIAMMTGIIECDEKLMYYLKWILYLEGEVK